jgi:serine/threonine protein kinase
MIEMTFGPGDRIGDYEVLTPLGAGGMGSVYKVRHAISQRVEALKVILPNASAAPETAERFLREIRLQASLEHPHIAALHNAFRMHDELVMVMEFVEGVSLREKLKSPGITLGQALEYARQVLEALVYAHAHGVIHRDIKPSNVMIAPHGAVKLLDFGLAASVQPAGAAAGPSGDDVTELTQPGTLLGSPYYISPEQALGERADAIGRVLDGRHAIRNGGGPAAVRRRRRGRRLRDHRSAFAANAPAAFRSESASAAGTFADYPEGSGEETGRTVCERRGVSGRSQRRRSGCDPDEPDGYRGGAGAASGGAGSGRSFGA